MTDQERELIFKMLDGGFATVPGLGIRIMELCRYKRKIQLMQFFISQRIVGKKFLDVLKDDHKDSMMSMITWAIKKIDSDVVKRPIRLGDDWN